MEKETKIETPHTDRREAKIPGGVEGKNAGDDQSGGDDEQKEE